MLTVTRIGRCHLNYFSSLLKQLHHLSHCVVFANLCHFSDDEDIFCIVLYTHLRQALKLAGWMDGWRKIKRGSDGWSFPELVSRPGKDETQTWLEPVTLGGLGSCWD